MEIKLHNITVRELVKDYSDDGEGGVRGYGGKLDIRPPYQREFVYEKDKRNAVIDTIKKGFPINVMYWAVQDDGTYEVIDGQQRTMSIAEYVEGVFDFQDLYFSNLHDDEQQAIYDYEISVYFCSGTTSERHNWFETINIAGERLTPQELNNATYHGPWLSDAKRYFSRTNGPAHLIGKDYMNCKAIRQEYLETALKWISDGNIRGYMGKHQHDSDAKPLWNYFEQVINWIESTFKEYRAAMKKVPDWGNLYNAHKGADLDPIAIEAETAKLMQDYDVKNKPGIYEYILTGEEKHLNIRTFDAPMKITAYERQGGLCLSCNKPFKMDDMHADHIDPWSKGGKTIAENCQMLCGPCNRRKSAK